MINIFVSRPNDITKEEKKTMLELEKFFLERDLKIRTIGSTDFPNDTPLLAVKKLMKECAGAVVIGFPQIISKNSIIKKNTENEKSIDNMILPTTWNHIEAAMAFMIDIPLLIIKDREINGGIFDIGVTENYIHMFDLSKQKWIKENKFIQPFNDWHKEILIKINSKEEKQ